MIANLSGSVEGRRHESSMLISLLQRFQWDQLENGYVCMEIQYVHLRWYLQCPFRGAHLTQQQSEFNKRKICVSVEWELYIYIIINMI